MSDTKRNKKRVKHSRVNFQMPVEELADFDALEIEGQKFARSIKARMAFNKFVNIHKRNKGE